MSELPAGRELDALIAEKVMGLCVRSAEQVGIRAHEEEYACDFYVNKPDASEPRWGHMLPLQPYSTDIRAAWEVFERVRHLSQESSTRIEHEGDLWHATFSTLDFLAQASGETAPLAICRAALKAAENFR